MIMMADAFYVILHEECHQLINLSVRYSMSMRRMLCKKETTPPIRMVKCQPRRMTVPIVCVL